MIFKNGGKFCVAEKGSNSFLSIEKGQIIKRLTT